MRVLGSYRRNELNCPYCKDSQMDAVNDGCIPNPFDDPEEWEWECESCEKKFLVSTEIVFNTKTDCEVNGEQHEYKKDDDIFAIYKSDNYERFKCMKCEKYKLNKLPTGAPHE